MSSPSGCLATRTSYKKPRYSKIITIGVDAGAETIKVVVLDQDGKYNSVVVSEGLESTAGVAQRALDEAVGKAKILVTDVDHITATGAGREYVDFANQRVVESLCLARGMEFLLPSTRTLLDLGARKSLAVKCLRGKPTKMASSGKCAAGTGTYLEMAASILRVGIADMNELFFKSTEDLEIVSVCPVFAETEIISLVHGGVKPEDIVKGVFRGLAGRAYSQLLEIGIEKHVAMVGGVARSAAMIVALEERVGFKVLVPENPEIVGALGAALLAQKTRNLQS